MKLSSAVLCAGAIAISACGIGELGSPAPTVDLAIERVSPDKVYNPGGTQVSVETLNGCDAPSLKIEGNPVQITKVSTDKYSFTAPPASLQTGPVSTKIELDCRGQSPNAPTTPTAPYFRATAEIGFSYDPSLGPTEICERSPAPNGSVSVLAKLSVQFCQSMDKASVEKAGNIGIQGVNGTTTYNAQTLTATFTPESVLAPEVTYTAFVKADVRSISGKPLHTTLNADGGEPEARWDTWHFTTMPSAP